jgi:hypothetical protein
LLYLRLAHGGGIVEVIDATEVEIEDDKVVLKAADGRVVCRFEQLDVLAFSKRLEALDDGGPEQRDDNESER